MVTFLYQLIARWSNLQFSFTKTRSMANAIFWIALYGNPLS